MPVKHSGSDAQEVELQLAFLEFLCEYLTRWSPQVHSPDLIQHKTWSMDKQLAPSCEEKSTHLSSLMQAGAGLCEQSPN